MAELQMGELESQFADFIWSNEPVATSDIVRIGEIQFDWKKSTTYTVLKRLCDKGIFQNNGGIVTSLISRDDYYAFQSERFVQNNFNDSLPQFLNAYTTRRMFTPEEIEYIRSIVDEYDGN